MILLDIIIILLLRPDSDSDSDSDRFTPTITFSKFTKKPIIAQIDLYLLEFLKTKPSPSQK
jgi:hypothetical protein